MLILLSILLFQSVVSCAEICCLTCAGSKRLRLLFVAPATRLESKVKAGTTTAFHTFFSVDRLFFKSQHVLLFLARAIKMTKKSLLRYIFRHGPNSKPRNETSAPNSSPRTLENASAPMNELNGSQPPVVARKTHKPAFDFEFRSDSRQSSILEDIAEEGSSGNDDASSSSAGSLATFDLDASPLSTDELLAATLNEAREAIHAHLDSLNTTLTLLDALEGFSATIPVLREEMEEKVKTCEEKIVALEDVEMMLEALPSRAEC
jgi:hypothetical protein